MAEERPPAAPAPDDVAPAPGPDGDHPLGEGQHTALPGRVERWRKRSATGAIMSGFAFGLKEVFEPERKEPAIVQETSGDPPEDLAVDAEFDPLVARRSVVRIRPWLLRGRDEAAGAGDGADAGPEGAPGPDAGGH
ncbi:MAG TPA: hypothetical protein VFP61_05635 [Acidimicrobiales bacterium]|nr:hypothetical protein [Acidimicrobiales bacterium]